MCVVSSRTVGFLIDSELSAFCCVQKRLRLVELWLKHWEKLKLLPEPQVRGNWLNSDAPHAGIVSFDDIWLSHIVSWLAILTVQPAKNLASPSGNRTPVSRVTGGDTYHYTNEDCWRFTVFTQAHGVANWANSLHLSVRVLSCATDVGRVLHTAALVVQVERSDVRSGLASTKPN